MSQNDYVDSTSILDPLADAELARDPDRVAPGKCMRKQGAGVAASARVAPGKVSGTRQLATGALGTRATAAHARSAAPSSLAQPLPNAMPHALNTKQGSPLDPPTSDARLMRNAGSAGQETTAVDPFGGMLDAFGASANDTLPHRGAMEQLFGHDFGHVNVSLNRGTALAAANAGAATRGNDIMFAGASPSRHLVAHELTHVMQSRGAVSGKSGVASVGSAAELEADAVAKRVRSSGTVGPQVRVSTSATAAVHFGPPDTGEKDKGKKDDVSDDLSLGDKDFEIRGEGVAVKNAWLAQDPALIPTAARMRAPTKIAVILRAFKTEGIFYWLRDSEVSSIAESLRIGGPLESRTAVRLKLLPSVFSHIGPPPNVQMQWRRGGSDGMFLVVAKGYIEKMPSVKGVVKLGEEFVKAMISQLEATTGLTAVPASKTQAIKNYRPTVTVASLKAGHILAYDKGQFEWLFGKDKNDKFHWDNWIDKGAKTAGGGSSALTGGLAFQPNVGIEDREFYISMMKKIGGAKAAASSVPVSKYRIDALRKIKGHANEKEILEAMRKGGGASTALSAEAIQQIIESVEVAKALEASGRKPRDTKKGTKPRFDELVRGRIINRGSRIWPGKAAEFDFKVENQRTSRELFLLFETTHTDVDWWAHPKGKPTEIVDKERTISSYKDNDFFNAKFPKEGTFVVHAVVNHTWYRQAHFKEEVLVKSEKDWLKDVEGDAFSGMGTKKESSHDFDTSFTNEWFGSDKYDEGRKFEGKLPKDWKSKSFDERTRFIRVDRARMQKLIDTYGSSGFSGHKDVVKYANDYLKTLDGAESKLKGMKKAGYKFFETRGTYLSGKAGVPDKQLHLVGAAKLTAGDPSEYKIKVEDYSKIAEPETLHYSATNATLKGAIEEVFLDMCKAYPPGRVSMLVELLDSSLAKSSGKTYGFELHTGTAWKTVKSKVWDPTVKIVVNIVGAATMIFLPVTAPIIFPLLAGYNITDTVDNLLDKHRKGILDTQDVVFGVMEIGMNVLPYLGQARSLGQFGKTTLFVIDGIEIGADLVMMTMQGMDQLRMLRDQNVAEIAKEYEWVQTTERNNVSHPDLAARKAALEDKIEKTRNLGKTIFAQMALEGAIMLASPVAFNHIAARAKRGSPDAMVADDLWTQKDGAEPTYDPKSGKIIGDKNNYDPVKLKKAAAAMEADLTKQQGRYAALLGTDAQKVSILREGSSLEVARFKNDEYVIKVPKNIDPAQVDLYLKQKAKEGIEVRKGTDSSAYRSKDDTGSGATKGGKPVVPVPGRTEGSFNVRHVTHGHNHLIGNPIKTKAGGHALLKRLAAGDSDALASVGISKVPKDFDPSTVEWGLGYRKASEQFVLVRGEPDAVDWGPFPDVVGVAHSHPFRESRRLKGTGKYGKGVHIDKMEKGGGHNNGNQTKVFPSASDVAYAARNELATHDVHTPYIHRGDGIIGNPKSHKKGEPTLSFSIKNAEVVGRWAGTEIPVYKATMIGHAKGDPIWHAEVWAVHHPTIGSLLHFRKPPAGDLLGTSKPTTPVKGKTRAGVDKAAKTTPQEQQAQTDWDRLVNDTSRDYKGKFKFNYADWVAHYREGWHFDFDAPTRNPWRKADAKSRHKPKYFAKTTSSAAVYRGLMGKGKSLRAYVAMLKNLGVIKGKKDVLDAIDGIKIAGRSHDAVRHELKTRFHDQVVARMAEPPLAKMKAKYTDLPWDSKPKEAYARASHAEMLEHTRGLNSSDKGNLVEDWYTKRFTGDDTKRHVEINAKDHPDAQMQGDRVADIVGVVDPGKVHKDRIGEIKSTDTKLNDHDRKQFDDYAKFLAAGDKLDIKGEKVKIKGVRYIFTSPAGGKANRTFIEVNLARQDIEVTFEVFTKDGKSHILKKMSDITPEVKAEWDG